jgi:tRNA nucleotidyltransferase/poly(A) polymerase
MINVPDIFPKTTNSYIVGGSVRDLILGQSPTDYDIAVLANPGKFVNMLTTGQKSRIVDIGKPGKMTTRVILNDITVDVVLLSGSTIQEDLTKRDFTINAMAFDLSTKAVIDCVGGMKDLKDKTVRMVSKDAFANDPIRMVRAFRLSAALGFDIEPNTLSSIEDNATLIEHTAPERIRIELLKMLLSKKSFPHLLKMADAQLLFEIIPELSALKNCHQNKFHEYDVFEHTMKAFQCLESLLDKNGTFMPNNRNVLSPLVHTEKGALLKFAMLLHDIGKPKAKTTDNTSRVRFRGHESISADMATSICKRLRFSSHETEYVKFIIKSHLWPLSLYISHQDNTLKEKQVNRFFMKSKENTLDLLLHAIADFKGKNSENNGQSDPFETFATNIIRSFFMEFKPKTKKPALITGDDLIRLLGLTPSPLFKTILERAEEARISNKINTKDEALDLAKKIIKNVE